jgi:hemerythrin
MLSRKLKEKEIMEKTIELIDEQHAALVQVIQWLDSNGHSNKPIRDTVDRVLNGTSWNSLERESDKEIKQAREVLKRYEYDDES